MPVCGRQCDLWNVQSALCTKATHTGPHRVSLLATVAKPFVA